MKLFKIETGTFFCDGGAMFGVVPKKVWQKRYPCNDDNFCKLVMRCLFIDTGSKRILIDTGAGTKQLDYLKYYHFKDIVDIEHELNKIGYSNADITDVVHTHLHFDHCGGATIYNADKKEVESAFPNAVYWLGEAQWRNFLQPNVREGDSFFSENMLPVEKAKQLHLINKDTKICPEVELRLFNGHSEGQIVPYIYTSDKTYVYVGDVIPLVASIPIAWVSAYDSFPVTSMKEKTLLLQEAAKQKQVLIFEHDAYNECCTVKNIREKYVTDEVFSLENK